MRARSTALLFSALLTAGIATAAPTDADPAGYTTQLLYLSVWTGPDNATQCTIEGELFVPNGLSPSNRAPASLTTNGFGGSYHNQVPAAQMLADYGYVTLAYSGLGFGGSECKISLDDPQYDGVAASQLVSFLGGQPGIAFTDPELRNPLPALDYVKLDATDHNGVPAAYDPRVGMFGGSYGGGIQFSAASVDARIDTLVPMITWNDLSYSLTPNGTSTTSGVSTAVNGAAKLLFAALLFGDGVDNPGVSGYVSDPARIPGCPNYIPFMCNAVVQAGVTGELGPENIAHLRHASVATYMDRIKIPVLLAQGQQDTLFDLNEATATYEALQARGVEVKMIWHSWGHSHLQPAPGEFSLNDLNPNTQYETGRLMDWFDHYLKDSPVDTGPEFAYFRNWVSYTGNAAPAYASSATFPVGQPRTFSLSGDRRLVANPADARPGAQTLVTGPGGLPTGLEPLNITPNNNNIPTVQIPGTEAMFTTDPMAEPLDVVGMPTVTLRIQSPGSPVIFAKVYDIAPDGSANLINGLIMPVRVADPNAPVPITLPGIVHRFDTGHSLRLVFSGGDISFRGGLLPLPVTIFADGSGPLTLPVTG
ncbi:CocE/NonD family hydrolase [Antrihabitans sp. YC2-6]|uniref:CocE/NonD family hydrolase n=1 Tax=Antrihabitans sp. YC2-6 TaxID=2799498 RepID=UPI0018F6492E|nr:CocE/NonD family hydrolase [Antrihabitans sp. YC2-6]MBJ8344842.1 ABC transporter ATP-binding protein [Antrihabitans sp. YC2-6]